MRDHEPDDARQRGAWLLPAYDEAALFFIAVTCLLLLLAPSGLWQDLAPRLLRPSEDQATFVFALLGVVAAGGLAVYHVFTSRPKNVIERHIFAAFVLVTSGTAGVIAGVQVLRSGTYSTAIFPIINLAYSVVLIYQLAIAEAAAITDDNAYIPGLIAGLLVLFVLFVCCLVVWHLTWAMTFSICVGYSTLASRVFTHLDYLWTMR